MPQLMSSSEDALRRVDALVQVALRLAGSAPSGRVALAKLAGALEPEWIPPPWDRTLWPELEAAHAAATEPIPFKAVERVLKETWGAGPGEELDELDPEPVAVTPTSQVHRGVLDGNGVAVKVLRPGLAAGIRQDLSLLEGLLGPLGSAFPGVDPKAIMREVRERVLDELDLEHEATVQRRVHRALRSHPYLSVPAPVTSLSHENVLVSEWVEGVTITQAPDPDQAAARLIAFVLGGIRAGIVHADPDPADVLVRADGSLAILDLGATRTVGADRAAGALALVEAFIEDDPQALGTALEQLGALPARYGETALSLARHALGELGESEPSRLDSAAVVAARDRLGQRPEPAVEVMLAGSLPPEDLWPLRGAALAFGTIARVGATGAWPELVLRALSDGWEAGL